MVANELVGGHIHSGQKCCDSVSVMATVADSDLSIAEMVHRTGPKPALARLINPSPETIGPFRPDQG